MKIEQAGGKVFANVDETLAEKIISRSKENSRATEPAVTGGMADPVTVVYDNDEEVNDDPLQFYLPDRPISLLKIAAAIVAFLVLLKLVFGRNRKK